MIPSGGVQDGGPPCGLCRVRDYHYALSLIALSLAESFGDQLEGWVEENEVGPEPLALRAERLAPVRLRQGILSFSQWFCPSREESGRDRVRLGCEQIDGKGMPCSGGEIESERA